MSGTSTDDDVLTGRDLMKTSTDTNQEGELDPAMTNQYALFEEFIAFLKVEKSEDGKEIKLLNSVLLGYWCNLFRSMVVTHPKEVFRYVYDH